MAASRNATVLFAPSDQTQLPSSCMRAIHTLLLLLVSSGLFQLAGAESARMVVGTASVDITPDYAIRLSGYGGRRTPSEGTVQHLFAKALSLRSARDGNLTLIITLDNLGIPAAMTERIYERIAAQVKLPREQFAICATHTHTVPMISGM